jgi:nucleolar protein TMA23
MDAHAHLLSLGWAGPGHSLDSRPPPQHKGRRGLAYDPTKQNNTGRGLVKPLLISQKKNMFGIGKKTHEPAAGNEWWLKGFENALSNIGKKGGSEATSGTATPESASASASGYRGKHTGLYGFFVKGQQMEGTIRDEDTKSFRGLKRKSDSFDDQDKQSGSSDSSMPSTPASQTSRKSKGKNMAGFAQITEFINVRDKDRKRGERRAKADPAQEFEQMGEFFEARLGGEREKRRQKVNGNGKVFVDEDEPIVREPKEERRQRRKDAQVTTSTGENDLSEKEKAAARSSSSENEITFSSLVGSRQLDSAENAGQESAGEVLRKAERKRRKEQRRLAK